MKTIYHNAEIYSRTETAFMTEEDHFSRFGSLQQLLAEQREDVPVVDLHGACVMPGFINAKMNLLRLGMELSRLDPENIESKEAFLEYLHRQALLQDESWLIGQITKKNHFPLPSRRELDAVCGRHPLALAMENEASMLINKNTLTKVKITNEQESAVVHGEAMERIKAAVLSPSVNTVKRWLKVGMQSLNQRGITAVGSDDFLCTNADWHTVFEAYKQLSFQQEMTVRVNELCAFKNQEELVSYLDAGYGMGIGEGLVTMGPLVLKAGGEDRNLRLWAQLAAKFNTPCLCVAKNEKEADQILRVMQDIVLEGNPLHQALAYRGSLSADQQVWLRQLHMDMIVDFTDAENRVFPFAALWEACNMVHGSSALKKISDLHKIKEISMEQMISACTENGARLFMADESIGSLEVGKKADFTVLSADMRRTDLKEISVWRTVVDGITVFAKEECKRYDA